MLLQQLCRVRPAAAATAAARQQHLVDSSPRHPWAHHHTHQHLHSQPAFQRRPCCLRRRLLHPRRVCWRMTAAQAAAGAAAAGAAAAIAIAIATAAAAAGRPALPLPLLLVASVVLLSSRCLSAHAAVQAGTEAAVASGCGPHSSCRYRCSCWVLQRDRDCCFLGCCCRRRPRRLCYSLPDATAWSRAAVAAADAAAQWQYHPGTCCCGCCCC